jgi:hypothetical protein
MNSMERLWRLMIGGSLCGDDAKILRITIDATGSYGVGPKNAWL